VHDPAARVPALEAETVVERDAELDESSVTARTALPRQSPRPARSVSSSCSAGESSPANAAATPPCASQLDDASGELFETSATCRSAAAVSAAVRPAMPLPTTIRS
jgi:hypothetical protein